MNPRDITFLDNGVTAEILAKFRLIAGWGTKPLLQYQKALENSLFSVTAVYNNKVIGIGRLIGDGVLDWYIKDIVIIPEYRGKGAGRALMDYLMAYINEHSMPETLISITLMASKGKEPFYEMLGFRTRPNDSEGAGMQMYRMTTCAIDKNKTQG